MGKVEKIATERDPHRVALGEAIEDRDEKSRAVERAKAALERANFLTEQAEARLESAKGALSAWRSDQAARVLVTASTGAPAAPAQSAREARIEVVDAEDAHDASMAALSACAARLSDATEDLNRAQGRVESAAADTLAGQIDRLASEAANLQELLHRKYEELYWVRGQVRFGGEDYRRAAEALPPPAPPGVKAREFRAPSEWMAAREALLTNPSAELPT
jgi:hypothetical protein